MTTATTPRRLRADAARNREALIDAAERVFASRGLAATLDDIAAAAGVNVATAYRHFANKHELAAAFLQQRIDQVITIAEQAAADDDPWRGLTGFLERILALMTANRGLHDVFTPGLATDWLTRLEERVDPPVRDLLVRSQHLGAVRPEVGVGDLGVLLQMLATVSDLFGADETLRRRYLGIVLDGLRRSDVRLAGTSPAPADVLAASAAPPASRQPRAGRSRGPAGR